jgi:membrane protein DedA with SNARE-associated domain
MSITSVIFDFAISIMWQFGYAGVFVLMVMESATLPIPSEVVLPFAGFLVYQGSLEFWTVVIVATIGSLVGTMIDYSIGYYLGRPAVLHYGRVVGFSERRLATAEGWFRRRGELVVLLARFVPLLRTLIAFPAGLVEMNVKQFLAYSAVGIVIWDIVLVYVGVLVGMNYVALASFLESIFQPVGIAVVVILGILAYNRVRRKKPSAQ